MAGPIVARSIYEALFVLVIFASILPKSLNALVTLAGIEIASWEQEPNRIDAVHDVLVPLHDPNVITEAGEGLLAGLPGGQIPMPAIVRPSVILVDVWLLSQHLGVVVETNARHFVIVDQADLKAGVLIEPNRRAISKSQIPCGRNLVLWIVGGAANAVVVAGVLHRHSI